MVKLLLQHVGLWIMGFFRVAIDEAYNGLHEFSEPFSSDLSAKLAGLRALVGRQPVRHEARRVPHTSVDVMRAAIRWQAK